MMTDDLFQTRLLRAGFGFGVLTIVMPLTCAAFTTVLIRTSWIATVLGAAMLPVSFAAGLILWQGGNAERFLEDLIRVVFAGHAYNLKCEYIHPDLDGGLPGTLVMIPVSAVVCGLSGFLATLISARPMYATTAFYVLIGLVYGMLLFGVLQYWILPLLAECSARDAW